MDHPLRSVVTGWLEKIRLASQVKKSQFQDVADECMRFFNGPHDFMYSGKYLSKSTGLSVATEADLPAPSFRMTVNKVAEMVQLFGPVLYHRNPVRQVNHRKPPILPPELLGMPTDPMAMYMQSALQMQIEQQRVADTARAALVASYLNYTPNELGLKESARQAIDEAIIKGMGVLWTETYQPQASPILMVGTFYDSVDNLLIDPDMHTIEDAQWIARKCVHPVWKVEREYGLAPGSLRGNYESMNAQAENNAEADGDYARRQGRTNDLLCYWKIFSKMGLGQRLSGVKSPIQDQLELLGDFCYLVIADGVPYPLNLPTQALASVGSVPEIAHHVQWPTPFWADKSAWPFTPIIFHRVPNQVWPMSHLYPGLGELKFLNWAYSFIASKIRTASRDIIAVQKSAGEEIKRTILHGTDYELMEIEKAHGTISEVVQWLQHPNFQGDIWKVIEAVMASFEKRVGLNELLYGMSSRQFRSAAEAEVKQANMQVRPDDMADKVEDAMTLAARKEALAARWHLTERDVAPILGPVGAQFWGQLVMSSDIGTVVHELEYRIEAGSARKPNKDRDVANMNQAIQTIGPVLQQYAMATGDFKPFNRLMLDWAKAIDLTDPEEYTLNPPPPPPPPDAEMMAQQAAAEQEMAGQAHQQQLTQQEQSHQQKMRQSDEKHKQSMKQSKDKAKAA